MRRVKLVQLLTMILYEDGGCCGYVLNSLGGRTPISRIDVSLYVPSWRTAIISKKFIANCLIVSCMEGTS